MNKILTGIVLLLAAILVYQWNKPVSLPGDAILTDAVELPEAESLEPVSVPGSAPFASFDEIAVRPLFIDGRRPPPEPEEGVVEEPQKPQQTTRRPALDLTAILFIENEQHAVFRGSRKQGLQKVRLGEDIEGWNVAKIEPKQVTLAQAGVNEVYLLREFRSVPLPLIPDKHPEKVEPNGSIETKARAIPPVQKTDQEK
jgi:hypothetical protein